MTSYHPHRGKRENDWGEGSCKNRMDVQRPSCPRLIELGKRALPSSERPTCPTALASTRTPASPPPSPPSRSSLHPDPNADPSLPVPAVDKCRPSNDQATRTDCRPAPPTPRRPLALLPLRLATGTFHAPASEHHPFVVEKNERRIRCSAVGRGRKVEGRVPVSGPSDPLAMLT